MSGLLTEDERTSLREYERGDFRIEVCPPAQEVLRASGLYDLCGDDESCEAVARFLLANDDKFRAALAADRAGVGQEVEQRDMAIAMLASWVACVQRNGTGWDDWDEAYKDAAYRPTPLRELLDAAIAKELKSWESPTPEASRAK